MKFLWKAQQCKACGGEGFIGEWLCWTCNGDGRILVKRDLTAPFLWMAAQWRPILFWGFAALALVLAAIVILK